MILFAFRKNSRSCNSEGLILKPSKPATAIDMQMYRVIIFLNNY